MGSYPIDRQFAELLRTAELDPWEVLRGARLPADLFSRDNANVTSAQYMRLMEAADRLAHEEGLSVRLACHDSVEQFSPVIFASYCARDGKEFLERLSRFKVLIAPIRYRLEELGPQNTATVDSDSPDVALPRFAAEGEIAFMLHLLRTATRCDIEPLAVEVATPASGPLRELIGFEPAASGINTITFRTQDLTLPFISHNESMWDFFEPELQRRLREAQMDDSMAARVRESLFELLPLGRSTIEDVAGALNYSVRTVQRRLSEEHTTFRKQLNHVRLLLAKQYLASTDMSIEMIAMMVGYAETNSFNRAFALWTGLTPARYRCERNRGGAK